MLTNFEQFLKHSGKHPKAQPKPLGQQLEAFMQRGMGDAVNDFKAEYQVTDKRIILARVKTLIDERKFEELMLFYEKRQKEFKIPVELVADLLLERGEVTWAMKMIARMPAKKKE